MCVLTRVSPANLDLNECSQSKGAKDEEEVSTTDEAEEDIPEITQRPPAEPAFDLNGMDDVAPACACSTVAETKADCCLQDAEEDTWEDLLKQPKQPKQPRVNMFIITPRNSTIFLRLREADTVTALKTQLRDRLGIEPDEQQLLLNDVPLLDGSESLEACGAHELSTFRLYRVKPSNAREIRIFMKLPTSEVVAIHASNCDTVGELKARVSSEWKYSKDSAVLRFRGQPLVEYRSLKSYNIEVGNVLHLLLRDDETKRSSRITEPDTLQFMD